MQSATAMISHLKQGSGDKTIRFRPSLMFQPKHAAIFLDRFEAVLKKAK